mmetsp:Transcript_31067/g.65562  ORF Transcript_31067/g.65562 Transcript_31067/m.65562 type:complete len:128 (-) Transcript_31067:437-820(-)
MPEITQEQRERAIAAAAERIEDPLRSWTRPRQDDCPICFIPLPLKGSESMYWICCGKTICNGCVQSQIEAHIRDGVWKAAICPFCRGDHSKYDPKKYAANYLKQALKLANAGHPEAIGHVCCCTQKL